MTKLPGQYDQTYTDYQDGRSGFCKVLRAFFLKNALRHVKGKTIDFGCGTGELLALLPKGSVGFDVNPYSVDYCVKNNLDVRRYFPEIDHYQ
jgi:hypothetical protein